MPFISRVTTTPPNNQLLEIEQIVIVDETGPVIPVGVSPGAIALVGEFLKGPFAPTEVFSSGELESLFGGVSDLLSQDTFTAARVQDGSGGFYDGNGMAALIGKQFRRLIIQRVDCDMVTAAAGTTKALVQFDVTIDATDQDPDDATKTGRDITIPAGTRFADDVLASATAIVALSQDVIIPAGSTITAGVVTIDETFENANGTLGATAFFVEGLTLASAALDTVIDAAIPGSLSTIAAAGISAITSAGAATAIFAPGTAGTLAGQIAEQYSTAIDKTLPTNEPMVDIVGIWSARNTSTIRTALWNNAIASSGEGRGRVALVAADPADSASSTDATAAKTAAKALQASFAGENGDRALISFPHVKVFSSTLNKNILVAPDSFRAMMVNQLPEEYQTSVPNSLMTAIQGLEDAFEANPLSRGDYVSFKANGVGAVRRDRTQGWQFQSAVTAANATSYPTRVKDNRRRFADFVQDTLAALASPYNKLPGTDERVDSLVSAIEAFLDSLVSEQNPSQQRILGYAVDPDSANTKELIALGIRTIIVKVKMLGDLDVLVFKTQIGPTVDLDE